MFLTVSVGILSCLVIKSLTDFSGSSVVCSGIQVKTRLSFKLRPCRSRMVSFMALMSAEIEAS